MRHFSPPVPLTPDVAVTNGPSPGPLGGGESLLSVDAGTITRLERLNASRQCILVIDLEGRPVWLNAESQKAVDAGDFPAVLGQDWLVSWPAAEQAAVSLAIESARIGIPARFVAGCRTMVREESCWDVNITPDGPRIAGAPSFTAYLLDVTDRRRALEHLHWGGDA